MIHAQREALVRELFSVHKQRKITAIILLKFVWVGVQLANKISVLNHGEQETFEDGT